MVVRSVTDVSGIDEVVAWLIDGAPGVTDSGALIARLGGDLCACGVPLDRLFAFVHTLHPSLAGRAFRWAPGTETTILELPTEQLTPARTNSPIGHVIDTAQEFRAKLEEVGARRFPVLDELAGEGFIDYFVMPLSFTSGETHAMAFSTKASTGFTDDHIAALRRVGAPLARLAEILALRRVAATLLSTYVGRNSGERILKGRIQKGDFETLRAVIWFSDLRGFTELTARASTREVIDTLNLVFECQVPPIEKHGGEVLKFMGDGMLAIFPLTAGADESQVADRALEAASEAIAAVGALVPVRRIGLALHIGELAYGNIGGHNRLDFTAIGPAVNIAARLEGLTSKLGQVLVLSEDLARTTTRTCEDLGAFELKGVPQPVRVFALRP